MDDELRVGVDDLGAAANRFEATAGELVGGASAGAGLSCQTSAAAVQAVHADAATTRAALAARMESTGIKVGAANATYVEQEVESTTRIRGLEV